MPKAPEQHIFGIDAFRALANALVLMFHAKIPYVSGPLGVMIFFVLSGYLITGILLREFEKAGDISLRDFYWNRTLRIFPAFYVCILVDLLLLALHHSKINWTHVSYAALYWMDYARALAAPSEQAKFFQWIAWSLAVEEQFYLLWPAALLVLLRKGIPLESALLWIIGSLWSYRTLAVLLFNVSDQYLYNAFEMRVDALLIGALLIACERRGNLPSAVGRITLAAVCGIYLAAYSIFESWFWAYPSLKAVTFCMLPVCSAVLLYQSKSIKAKNIVVSWIARLSYSLYLYHIIAHQEAYQITLSPSGTRIISIVGTVVLAALSYRFIELPFMRYRTKGAACATVRQPHREPKSLPC